MRILTFTTSPSNFRTGGMEVMLHALTASLRARGHHVVGAYGEDEYHEGVAEQNWGLPLASIRTWKRIPTISSVRDLVASYKRLDKCLKTVKPDVVYVHFITFVALYFVVLKYKYKYRLVVGARGSDLFRANSISKWAMPRILKNADAVIVISEALRKQANRLGANADDIHRIYNGLDVEWWSTVPSTSTKDSVDHVVFVGRLERVKGPDILLSAFLQLLEENKNVRLDIVGGGALEEDLMTFVAAHGISEYVTFWGAQSRENVREVLHHASVYVMPSRSEGLGLALLEAMSAGVPVIASNVGGIPEIIDDDYGILVASEDSESLAESLLYVLDGDEIRSRLSKAAKRRAIEFGWEKCVDRYEQVLCGSHVSYIQTRCNK